ncbi:hypothetical protein RSAG8_11546, partial [Rhizoctonia solani AG-8 WAC10335]
MGCICPGRMGRSRSSGPRGRRFYGWRRDHCLRPIQRQFGHIDDAFWHFRHSVNHSPILGRVPSCTRTSITGRLAVSLPIGRNSSSSQLEGGQRNRFVRQHHRPTQRTRTLGNTPRNRRFRRGLKRRSGGLNMNLRTPWRG